MYFLYKQMRYDENKQLIKLNFYSTQVSSRSIQSNSQDLPTNDFFLKKTEHCVMYASGRFIHNQKPTRYYSIRATAGGLGPLNHWKQPQGIT